MREKNSPDALDSIITFVYGLGSDIVGKKIPKRKLTPRRRRELLGELSKVAAPLASIANLQEKPPRNDLEWIHSLDLLNSEMKRIGTAPANVHFAEYMVEQTYKLVRLPLEFGHYLRRAGYLDHCKEIESIASKIFDRGLGVQCDFFFNKIVADYEMANSPQFFSIRSRRSFQYLSRTRRRLSFHQLHRLISIYLEMAGAYEQSAGSLVGLLQILEGAHPDPSGISKMSLRTKLEFIAKRSPKLTSDLNVAIRNSIAHPSSYAIHFSDATIVFRDRSETVVLGFREFVRLCRKLSALSAAVSMTYSIFLAERWSRIWHKYCALKKVHRTQEQVLDKFTL